MIRGQLFYQNYFFDSFHVITSDLYTLTNNQIEGQTSYTQVMLKAIKTKTLEDFIFNKKKQKRIFINAQKFSSEDLKRHNERLDLSEAKQLFSDHLDLIEKNFPNTFRRINETQKGLDDEPLALNICLEDHKLIKGKLKELEKFVKPYRNQFNHKYETKIVSKITTSNNLMIEDLENFFEKYFDIVNSLSIVYDGNTHPEDVSFNYKENAISIILLILFDSIDQISFWKKNIVSDDKQTKLEKLDFFNDTSNAYTLMFRNKSFIECFVKLD